MKTRLFTLIAFSILSSMPAFAMRENEGPQFSRRWTATQAKANVSENVQKREWSETSGRALSSDESMKANEEKSSAQKTEAKKETMGEMIVRRPPHHTGMGER